MILVTGGARSGKSRHAEALIGDSSQVLYIAIVLFNEYHHTIESGVGMMILVTGGARSGKSRHAEALIGDSSQVLYIATSQILDEHGAGRVATQRRLLGTLHRFCISLPRKSLMMRWLHG